MIRMIRQLFTRFSDEVCQSSKHRHGEYIRTRLEQNSNYPTEEATRKLEEEMRVGYP